MFSLFSSFDYYWSIFPNYFEISFLSLFFVSTFVLRFKSFSFSALSSALSSFLERLSPKGFRKSSVTLFLSLITFILFLNFYSVLPFVFPHTSQVGVVFLLGLRFWVSFFMFFNFYSPKGFLSHRVPEGSPIALVPVLFSIELVRNIIRPITLTVRLVANILAGHLLLILLSKVVYRIRISAPSYLLLNLVEFFVAAVQSYIFLTIITLYYCDVS